MKSNLYQKMSLNYMDSKSVLIFSLRLVLVELLAILQFFTK